MELAIEIDGRHSERVEFVSLANGPITLGRGFHCDLLLRDKTVDGTHATVAASFDEGGNMVLSVTDEHSANGTRLNGRPLTPGTPQTLRTGDQLQLGRTRLRVYRRDHPVGPAHSPTRLEQLKETLAQGPALLLVSLTGLALYLWLAYLNFGGDVSANIVVRKVMDFALQAGLWMLFWGTVNKLVRGEFNFWPHWCLGVAVAALVPALDELLSIIGFNWQSLQGFRLLDALTGAAVGVLAVFVALSFATHLGQRTRITIALVPALTLLLTSYALPLITDQRNVAAPQLLGISRPPAFKWAGASSAEKLIADSGALFEQAELVAQEQLAKEAEELANLQRNSSP